MLFVTNRIPKQSNRTRRNRKISFDLQETGASQHMYFCERKGPDDYIEIGKEMFFSRLKNLSDDTQVLFYIHGFNNTGEKDIFPRAEKLQHLFDSEGGAGLIHVVPLIWPCDDDSAIAILDDYWDDQDAADASGCAFSRFLGKFQDWQQERLRLNDPCYRRINLMAHSMGNRVLMNALQKWACDRNNGGMPLIFRNIFMVAADVKNNVLEDDKPGRFIPDAARNVVVYYAKDDLAMPASKVANAKNKTLSRRMGMTGPRRMDKTPENVYRVDCDNFNNTCDDPKGHSYFLECPDGKISPVLGHMVRAVKTGRIDPNVRHDELQKP